MFRWNSERIKSFDEVYEEFKFHYVQMELILMILKELHLDMFKFHYVQMERKRIL